MKNCEVPNHIHVEETLLFNLKQKISSIGFINISKDEMKSQIRIYKEKHLSKNSLLYIARCLIMFGNKYDYSKAEYKKSDEKICIICPEHGEFWQTPNKHREGRGCPKCGREQLRKTMINKCSSNFIKKCEKIHGINRYNYSKVEYNGTRKRILIKCNVCGNEFYQVAGNHLKGKGCPICSESHMEKKFRTKLESFGFVQGIDFYREYSFSDLLGDAKHPLRYDFFIPSKNLLIELDGEQHYRFREYFQTMEEHNKILKYDKMKTKYANDHNIKLLRIKYTKFDRWINNINSLNNI